MSGNRILVLGIGNEILSDDGIGPRLIGDLAGLFEDQLLEFKTVSCGGLEIMELLSGFDKAILIDAIRTEGGKPGDVHYFKVSEFMETSNLSNLHDINFITSLKLAKLLDIDITDDIHFIAVEIETDLEFSEKLTPALEKSYAGILENVSGMIKKITCQ